jgi:hypothetical protein
MVETGARRTLHPARVVRRATESGGRPSGSPLEDAVTPTAEPSS